MRPADLGPDERSVEVDLQVEFYECDPMQVVWHGEYINYMERGRRTLLDAIGYNYIEMKETGYSWPVVDIQVKYIRPLSFSQRFRVRATLADWENRIKIDYLIYDPATGQKVTKGSSVQMAIDMASGESLFATPRVALDRIEAWLARRRAEVAAIGTAAGEGSIE
jgi:acyl-CoA thioester hydrolase